MEVHTNMFEVAPKRTPTPLAAMEAEHAQSRRSSDLVIFFSHLTFLFDLLNILIPWDSSCEQGGKAYFHHILGKEKQQALEREGMYVVCGVKQKAGTQRPKLSYHPAL